MNSPAARPLRLLLIDDHALFRDGLALLLRRLDAALHLVEASHCGDALAALEQPGAAFDLAIVDLHLPGMPGLDALSVLRARCPAMPLVVMSSDDDPATITAALDRGAMGYIPKSARAETMLAALRAILAGEAWVPPSAAVRAPAPTTPESIGLTPRQGDVLRLILRGLPAKLIARELGLGEATVKTHTSAVLRALGVTTRTQAVLAAVRLGLRLP